MTRRSRRDAEKRIERLEDALRAGVENASTEQLYIASLEAGMPGPPHVDDDLADRIGEEYRRRIAQWGAGGGDADE